VGSALVLVVVGAALVAGRSGWLWAAPLVGYGFAWVGHYGFEHDRPATFRHPLDSLMGDRVMFRDVLTGRLPW
jgi:hypothetical protein